MPADIQMLPKNFRDGPEFKGGTKWEEKWWEVDIFAETLEQAYEEAINGTVH